MVGSGVLVVRSGVVVAGSSVLVVRSDVLVVRSGVLVVVAWGACVVALATVPNQKEQHVTIRVKYNCKYQVPYGQSTSSAEPSPSGSQDTNC